jgi:hypothetical protein
MGSSSKRRMTMAKRARERMLKERREKKQEKKDEKKRASVEAMGTDTGAPDEVLGQAQDD